MKPPVDTVPLPDHGPDAIGVVAPRRMRHVVLPCLMLLVALLQLWLWVSSPDPRWHQAVLGPLFLVNGVLQYVGFRVSTGLLLVVDDQGLRMRNQWRGWTAVAWEAVTGLEIEENGRVLRVHAAPGSIRRRGAPVPGDRYRFVLFSALPTSKARLLAYLEHRRHAAGAAPA